MPSYRQPVDDEETEDLLGGLCRGPEGLVYANGMARVFVWSRDSGEPIAVHETTAICRDGYPTFRPSFDPAYGRLTEAHGLRSFALWDVARWERIATFDGHTEPVRQVAFVGEDQVLSVSGDGSLRRWDAWSAECHQTVSTRPLYVLADAPSSDRVAVAGGGGQIYVCDRRTLAMVAHHEVPLATARHSPLDEDKRRRLGIVWNRPSPTITAMTWHPDGEHLVCGSWDFVPKMIHATTGRCVRQWHGHAHWVDAIAVDPTSGSLVTGSSDHTVRVWDLDREHCRAMHELSCAHVSDILIDDGRILAIGGDEIVVLPLG